VQRALWAPQVRAQRPEASGGSLRARRGEAAPRAWLAPQERVPLAWLELPVRALPAWPEQRLGEASVVRVLLLAEVRDARERPRGARGGPAAASRASGARPLAGRLWALPFRDRVQVALARRRAAQSAHARQRLRIASPKARSWQAARDEVLS